MGLLENRAIRNVSFLGDYLKGKIMEIDLEHIFTHHAPEKEDIEKYTKLRNAAKEFAETIIKNTPKGADQTATIRKIREAVMTANASIALKGRLNKET